MSNLILFTNRSGSTILQDILSYADGSINLGEGLHSIVRDYNYNTTKNKQSDLYGEFAQFNLTGQYHNQQTRGSDHIGFTKGKQKRINLLKNTSQQWTVKEQLEKQTIDVNFIDYCARSDINIYMTHRRDVVAQFKSKINARYRLEVATHLHGRNHKSQFIFTNQDAFKTYEEMRINFLWLHLYTNVFIEQLMIWRVIYERYKDVVKLVSYEDCIKPMNFESLKINSNIVEQYKKERKHLVPTPFNCERVVVTDDHPKPIIGAWQQSLYYVEKHKYLVEV